MIVTEIGSEAFDATEAILMSPPATIRLDDGTVRTPSHRREPAVVIMSVVLLGCLSKVIF
jgi:hypothetical protein